VPWTRDTQHTVGSALDFSFGQRAALVGAGAAECGDFSSVMKQGNILPRERYGLLRSFRKFGNGNGLRVVHAVVVFRRRIMPSRKPLLLFPQIRELFVPSRLSVSVLSHAQFPTAASSVCW
jgi:hypothetical protein